MTWSLDARIPVILWTDAAPPPASADAAILGEAAFDAAPLHPIACTCCTGRSDAALALDRLFQGRARGTLPWFKRVIAIVPNPEAQAAIRAALAEDALTAARYRRG